MGVGRHKISKSRTEEGNAKEMKTKLVTLIRLSHAGEMRRVIR